MREIKFRQPIYDKDGKFVCFHYWGYLKELESIMKKIDSLNSLTDNEKSCFVGPIKGESQQYTGLKDKNGKEIYEGDKVEIPYVDPIGRLDIATTECVANVIFEHGRFALNRYPESQGIVDWCKKEKGKYICNYGNITIIKDETVLKITGDNEVGEKDEN